MAPRRGLRAELAAAGLWPDRLTVPAAPRRHAALEWAASGRMHLTGWAGEAPLVPEGDVIGAVRDAAVAYRALAATWGNPVDIDVPVALFGRAALAGHQRAGRRSPGGSCRLLHARDGWIAVNLARPDDVACVPAVIGEEMNSDDPWTPLAAAATTMAGSVIVERAQLLGIPAATLGTPQPAPPFTVERLGSPGRPRRLSDERPLVIDLSSMWAGPLAAHLLGRAGARVVKVESLHRPDGARGGLAAFYEWLHAGHESVAVDFTDPAGVSLVRALLERADVVVEASRPRALRQLGLDAEELVSRRAGLTWVSITGHGRTGPAADLVGFGDDAAVAGGLVAFDTDGGPVFAGDAIADPIAGLYAACGAAASIATGGGHLVAVALADVAAHSARAEGPASDHDVVAIGSSRWAVRADRVEQPVLPPRRPPASPPARPFGADTEAVFGELAPHARR